VVGGQQQGVGGVHVDRHPVVGFALHRPEADRVVETLAGPLDDPLRAVVVLHRSVRRVRKEDLVAVGPADLGAGRRAVHRAEQFEIDPVRDYLAGGVERVGHPLGHDDSCVAVAGAEPADTTVATQQVGPPQRQHDRVAGLGDRRRAGQTVVGVDEVVVAERRAERAGVEPGVVQRGPAVGAAVAPDGHRLVGDAVAVERVELEVVEPRPLVGDEVADPHQRASRLWARLATSIDRPGDSTT
jgi:hypothetical protein